MGLHLLVSDGVVSVHRFLLLDRMDGTHLQALVEDIIPRRIIGNEAYDCTRSHFFAFGLG